MCFLHMAVPPQSIMHVRWRSASSGKRIQRVQWDLDCSCCCWTSLDIPPLLTAAIYTCTVKHVYRSRPAVQVFFTCFHLHLNYTLCCLAQVCKRPSAGLTCLCNTYHSRICHVPGVKTLTWKSPTFKVSIFVYQIKAVCDNFHRSKISGYTVHVHCISMGGGEGNKERGDRKVWR